MREADRLAQALATVNALTAVQNDLIALSERVRALHRIVMAELKSATEDAQERVAEMPTNVQPEPRRIQ